MQLTLPNFFEFLKFYAWVYYENRACAKQEKREQKVKDAESSRENLKLIIEQAQADIDVLKKKANAEIDKANEMMRKVKGARTVAFSTLPRTGGDLR